MRPGRKELRMKSDDEEENVITLEERRPGQSHEVAPTRDLFAQSRLPEALESVWRALPEAKPEVARKGLGTFHRTDWALFAYIDLSSRFRDMRATGLNEDNSLRILIHEFSVDLFVSPNPHEDSPARAIVEYTDFSMFAYLWAVRGRLVLPSDELIQQEARMLLCAMSDTKYHFDSILYLPPELRQRRIDDMARCYGVPSDCLLSVERVVRAL